MSYCGTETGLSGTGDSSDRRRSRARGWHIVFILLVSGLICVLLLRWHWRRQFRERIEAVHAAGYPVTLDELDVWYEWPSGGNGAYRILDAAALHEKLSPEDSRRLEQIFRQGGSRPDLTEPLPDDLAVLLRAYVRNNSKALQLLHGAAAVKHCRYPIDLSKGLATRMPHIGEVRDGCLLLCLEAVLCAERSDPNGAAQAIASALGVARSLDQEPALISHLVRMSGVGRAACTLERALNRTAFADAQLQMLRRAFSDIRTDDGLLRALASERCMQLSVFERPGAIDRSSFGKLPPVLLLEAYGALGLSAREGAIFLSHMDECIRITRLPTFQRCAAAEAAENRLRRRAGLLLGLACHTQGVVSGDVWTLAQIEMARAALAVERYRLALGVLPTTLSQLVPKHLEQVPVDPFDGLPLRYKKIDRGFVVYSVGEDGRDDGPDGAADNADSSNRPCDLTFWLRR